MEAISILGWKNEHELNHFPFTQPLVSDQGVEIPNGIFVDAQIVTLGEPRVRVKSIAIASDSIIVELQVVSAETSYLLTSRTDLNSMSTTGADIIDSNGLSFGKFVFGRSSTQIAKKTLNKIYTFRKNEYLIEPSCILSLGSSHVTGITTNGVKNRGAVTLKEGNGVKIITSTSGAGTIIRIDAVGSSLDECCKDDYLPLKKLNMVSPDGLGNVQIGIPATEEPSNKDSLRETIKITKIANGIKLETA